MLLIFFLPTVHVQVCKCNIPYLYRDQYSDILTRQWVDIFNEIFDEDNYTPIYVESVEEYTAIVTQFPFQDEELEQVKRCKMHKWIIELKPLIIYNV